jgi:hypothetical protein
MQFRIDPGLSGLFLRPGYGCGERSESGKSKTTPLERHLWHLEAVGCRCWGFPCARPRMRRLEVWVAALNLIEAHSHWHVYSQAEQFQVLDGSNFRNATNEPNFKKRGQFFSAIIRFIEIKASPMDDPAASKQVNLKHRIQVASHGAQSGSGTASRVVPTHVCLILRQKKKSRALSEQKKKALSALAIRCRLVLLPASPRTSESELQSCCCCC